MVWAAIALCMLASGPAANTLAAPGAAQVSSDATVRGKEFWQGIAKNDYNPPAGETAAELSRSLSPLLASPDPELRDEIGYTTFAYWIYQKRLLSPDDLRPLIAEWLANLKNNVGTTGSDSVLRRSFSALVLSVVVARDNAAPFLDEAQFRAILEDALAYADAEKDLRGYDPEKGWMHSAAHTADLLKFLGRSRYLTSADQSAILSAVARKMSTASLVFTFGEDERMARAVLSLIARPDFDAAAFRSWLAMMKPAFPDDKRPTLAQLAAYQNRKNLLSKLEVLLVGLPADAPHAKEVAPVVEEALKSAF
ncbi:MAG TPA: DUF2785 domain-containing protein [Terriglobales bacterium]|nr:DUF2785 domain-containing protein [Terriglobales bacterium]